MRTNILTLSLLSLISANIFATGVKTVSLKMSGISTGLSGTTQIYFAPGTSINYVSGEDSRENFDGPLPLIYFLTADGVACNSNGFGNLGSSVVIAIGYQVQQAGAFVFSDSTGFGMDPGSLIMLEDKTLGTFTDLRKKNDTVQIAEGGQNQTRFCLHISAPPVITTIGAGCTNQNGAISISEDTTVTWSSILLFDSSTVMVQQLHYVKGAAAFSNLKGGRYLVGFFTSSGYLFVDRAEVADQSVQLSINSSCTNAAIGENIEFHALANDASEYSWNFGDGTIINGVANPSHAFSANGAYNVELNVTNDFQCTAETSVTISVGRQQVTAVVNAAGMDMNIYSYNKSVIINSSSDAGNRTCEIYNLAGQLLVTLPVTPARFIIDLDNQPAGIYLVQMKTATGSFTKKIFIE